MRCLVAALLVFGATASAISQDRQACAVSENFANPKLLAAMRRGVNLPGWDHPDESRRPSLAQLQALRDKGFTHIRLLLDDSRLSGDDRAAYLDQMFEQIVFLAQPRLCDLARSPRRRKGRCHAIRLKRKNT